MTVQIVAERRVVRTGVSPLNPKVKWAEYSCGHEVYLKRRPRVGTMVVCKQCSEDMAVKQP